MGLARLRISSALYVVGEREAVEDGRRLVERVHLGMKESYLIPGCRVERVVLSGSTQTVLMVRTERRDAQCPSSKQYSDVQRRTATHST
jgi:hypothetical protein